MSEQEVYSMVESTSFHLDFRSQGTFGSGCTVDINGQGENFIVGSKNYATVDNPNPQDLVCQNPSPVGCLMTPILHLQVIDQK